MADSFRIGTDGIYRCDAFQEFIWQKHGFGTRYGNPDADVTLKQIHSNIVLNARGLKPRQYEGDALVTDEIGRSIGVRTADCVPILLLDPRTRTVAAVHAGWRGTAAGIVTNAIFKMKDDFEAVPADLYAAIGPSIRHCCYEVSDDVAQQFSDLFPEWNPSCSGKRKINLCEANRRQMQAAGIHPERMFDCGLCTACDTAQFYSFRREPENPGRTTAAIARLA